MQKTVSNQIAKTLQRATELYQSRQQTKRLTSLQLLASTLHDYQIKNNIDCFRCEAGSWLIHEKESQEIVIKFMKCRLGMWVNPPEKLRDDDFLLGFVMPGQTSFCSEFCETEEQVKQKISSKNQSQE